jgi:hypothetical protein
MKVEVVTVMQNQSKKSYDVIAALVAVMLIGVVHAVTVGFGIGPDALAALIALPL